MAGAELLLLGTGNAFHHDGRGSQCLLVRCGARGSFLVDLGPTAMAAMMRFGVDTKEADRLFVTHLHGDHIAGWPFLLLHMTFIDRRAEPFFVHGPPGVEDCLTGLMRLCYADLLDRPEAGVPVRYEEFAIGEGQGVRAGDSEFDVIPMDHHPTSVGYRFDVRGATLAVSGDTRWCDGLERLARGADLLVIECTSVSGSSDAHLCLDEIRARIDRLPARNILLVHLTDEVATALAVDPIPRVTAGYDGLSFPF